MPGPIVALLVATLAAVAALYALSPGPEAPPATRSYAVAGFFLLLLALAAVLAELARRRRRQPALAAGPWLDPQNRREVFRIPYPEDSLPRLRVSGAPDLLLEVLDLSEEGARVRCPGQGRSLQGELSGEILFPGGQVVAVEGAVVRRGGAEAALRFCRPLPPALLLGEQRRLRAHLRSRQP